MVTRRDYDDVLVQAAYTVMLELFHLLGEYRDDIVIIGGWVPALLISPKDKHVGSIDVDLALNHNVLQDPGYETIRDLLLRHGYKQDNKQPFIFWRLVTCEDRMIEVEVDFLAGEYEGTGKHHRTQIVQDIRARKARGCELAFQLKKEVSIDGILPDGAEDTVKVCVASIVAFIVMKGMALSRRVKEKDPWDIYYCIRNWNSGLDALLEEFQPYVKHGLVREGLQNIAEKFASPDHIGPKSVADFEEITDSEARAQIQRDAYERVNAFLERLEL